MKLPNGSVMKILHVVGTRPNFMKISPIIRELSKHREFDSRLIHTGQHYDQAMSHMFFRELQIPEPDIFLEVGSDTHARQVARIMERFDDVCDRENPDAVLVVGDVNSTMAATLVASKKGIPVVHVEAGIRSNDRTMPEEINRIVTDSLADLLLPPSEDAVDNLLSEGHHHDQIHLVGNIMIDTLESFRPMVEKSGILEKLGLKAGTFASLTLHRPSNVDDKPTFVRILNALRSIQKKIPIIFPVHPRTRKMIEVHGFDGEIKKMPNLVFTDALGYFDFGKLISSSAFVLTDSGGIQEETTIYNIPCITLRENTERPITIIKGTNELAGSDTEKIISLAMAALKGNWKKPETIPLWDGKTARRIAEVLKKQVK